MKKTYFRLEWNLIVLEADDIVRLSIGNEDNDVTVDDPYGDF